MQKEVAAGISVQRIDDLLIIARAKRGHHQALGFAAGKQGRAVGAWQHAGFADNFAHIACAAPVDTFACFYHVAA